MSNDNKKIFDVIIWGASGFTGKLVAQYFANTYGCDGESLKWAMAGRSLEKLKEVQNWIAPSSPDINKIPILTANIDNLETLISITSKTKVLCTTVGPYNLYGKTILQACLETDTNYCDLTGEPNFIRYSIDNFHQKALSKKIHFIHSCGFDSIPSDMGTLFLQTKSLEKLGSYCKEVLFVAGDSRGSFSGGTIASLLGVVEEAVSSEDTRRFLSDPYSLNPEGFRGPDEPDPVTIEYIPALKTWTAPFVMGPVNTRVVRRTNALLNNKYSSDFRYQERMGFGDGIGAWFLAQSVRATIGSILGLGAIPFTRDILKKYVLPAAGEGPSEEDRESGYFNISILGFKEKISDEASIQVDVFGKRDPGYGATCRMLGEAAISIAKGEVSELYGVVTPASALGIGFLNRLEKVGITFNIK